MANAEDAMKNEKRITGMVSPQMAKKGPFTVEAAGVEKKKGETVPRRNLHSKKELIVKPSAEVSTVYENLKRAAAKFGNAKAIGSRKIIKTHVENKKVKKVVDGQEQQVDKKWTYFELSGYTYMSFIEYEQLALSAGSGLRHLGLKKDDKMHLYGATRYAVLGHKPRYHPDLQKTVLIGWACLMLQPHNPSRSSQPTTPSVKKVSVILSSRLVPWLSFSTPTSFLP